MYNQRISKNHRQAYRCKSVALLSCSDSLLVSDLPSYTLNLILNFNTMTNKKESAAHTTQVPNLEERLVQWAELMDGPEENAVNLQEFLKASIQNILDDRHKAYDSNVISCGYYLINELCNALNPRKR